MSEGVSTNINIKSNFDGSAITTGFQQMKQTTGSITTAIQQDFKSMASGIDAATNMMVAELNTIDRELNKLGRASGRGLGTEQLESINALQNRLGILREALQAHAPANFMQSVSTEATIARTNLAHVETMLNRMNNIRQQAGQQAGLASVYNQAGVVAENDPRYLAALRGDQHAPIPQMLTGGARGSDAILMAKMTEKEMLAERKFYAQLERDEEKRKRREEQEWNRYVSDEKKKESKEARDARREELNYERALKGVDQKEHPLDSVRRSIERNAGPVGEHPAVQMVRDAFERGSRLDRAKELTQNSNFHYDNQIRQSQATERQWMNSNNRPPPMELYQIDTSNSLDLRYQAQLRQESYQREKNHQDEMFRRETSMLHDKALADRGNRYGPVGPLPPVYGPFQSADATVAQAGMARGRGDRTNWMGGRDNRQFMGQQLAYGVDDMVQQYMWSNSTAAGISAAARAGGNNLSAVVGASNMNPMHMMGAMVGVQGIAMAASMYAKYIDETNKAKASTEALVQTLDDVAKRASREVKFKYSLEDSSSKELKADARAEDARAEARKPELELTKRMVDGARKRLTESDVRQKRIEELAAAEEIGGLSPEERSELKKLRETENAYKTDYRGYDEKIVKDKSGELDKLSREEKDYEREKTERDKMIEKREASERSAKEREKRSKLAAEGFFSDLEREEKESGYVFSGDELRQRFDRFAENRYDLNLQPYRESMDERAAKQDERRSSVVYDQSKDAQERDKAYQIEKANRTDIFGDIRAEFQSEMERIAKDYKMLAPEQREVLEGNARDKALYRMGEKSEEYDKGLRSNYKALSGITSGSEEDAQLKARLTVQTDLKSDAERQIKLLEEVANNTKPRRQPESTVVRFA
ncbi:hypothetical protein UFOVP448_20 [uncultured Caudovirales phage]|uniref:Uncharacterized protein n=1 Tax=uncultured Caudovirales phage TaxID=2100421 RepID=A0A6J5M778_9CAUD|nr:hypothetical protein UFOVP448_20 [uncultured Caudovirales phage]